MYCQVVRVTPLPSVSGATGRTVWIMQLSQFSLSFGHILLHGVNVNDATHSGSLFCWNWKCFFFVVFFNKNKNSTKDMNCPPFTCSPVLDFVYLHQISLQHVSVWPQIASVQGHSGSGAYPLHKAIANIFLVYFIILLASSELEKHFLSKPKK